MINSPAPHTHIAHTQHEHVHLARRRSSSTRALGAPPGRDGGSRPRRANRGRCQQAAGALSARASRGCGGGGGRGELVDKRAVEGGDGGGDLLELVGGREEGGAHVVRLGVGLAEARPRHHHQTRRVEQPHRVELVRRDARLARRGDRRRREGDAREEVERALSRRASDAGQRVKRGGERVCACAERLEDGASLCGERVVGGHAGPGRRDDQTHGQLADDVRAEADGGELDELRPHAVVPVAIEGEEAAAQPALAIEALRGGVHRDELRSRSQLRLRLPQQRERAPEGVEVVPPLAGARGSAVVDVRLVDLVCEQNEPFPRRKLEHGCNLLRAHALASRVAGVDHDERAHVRPPRARELQRRLEVGHSDAPRAGGVFGERVERGAAVEQRREGRVERVDGRGRQDRVDTRLAE
mmetsp:Transcript_34144/g.109883  ORF Transcript_34144/g.109883 Transcript_34144/m.109883 type:complete len:413 (+) Transcript_34144:434-1672(+)